MKNKSPIQFQIPSSNHYTHHFTLIPPVASTSSTQPSNSTTHCNNTLITVNELHSNLQHRELKIQLYNEYIYHYCIQINVIPNDINISHCKLYIPYNTVQYLYGTNTVTLTTVTHHDKLLRLQQQSVNKQLYTQQLSHNILSKQLDVFHELRLQTSSTGNPIIPYNTTNQLPAHQQHTNIDELTDQQIEHIDYIQYIFMVSHITAHPLYTTHHQYKHNTQPPSSPINSVIITDHDTIQQLQQSVVAQLHDIKQYQQLFNTTINEYMQDKNHIIYHKLSNHRLNRVQQLCSSDSVCTLICLCCHMIYQQLFRSYITASHITDGNISELSVEIQRSISTLQCYIESHHIDITSVIPYILDSVCTCIHYIYYKQYDTIFQYELHKELIQSIIHSIQLYIDHIFEYTQLIELTHSSIQHVSYTTSQLIKHAVPNIRSVEARRIKHNELKYMNKYNRWVSTGSHTTFPHNTKLLDIALDKHNIK